jgi:hypothetical protein
MSSKRKIKKTSGIRHYEGVDISSLKEGTASDVAEMSEVDRSKIRITTMIDTDILDELKRRSKLEGDGRYQTYLNHFLREVLFKGADLDSKKMVEIVLELVRPDALKRRRVQ